MIASWPGVTGAGSVCQQPVNIEDFFSTILEMANLSKVEQIGGVIDGLSFLTLLRGEQDKSRETRPLVWHFPNNWGPRGPGIGPSSAIRLGDWKLIYYHGQFHKFPRWGKRTTGHKHMEMRNVRGRLLVTHRTRIDGYATANMTAICDLTDDGSALTLGFTQFYLMPGA